MHQRVQPAITATRLPGRQTKIIPNAGVEMAGLADTAIT
jgi:hypothetical protein